MNKNRSPLACIWQSRRTINHFSLFHTRKNTWITATCSKKLTCGYQIKCIQRGLRGTTENISSCAVMCVLPRRTSVHCTYSFFLLEWFAAVTFASQHSHMSTYAEKPRPLGWKQKSDVYLFASFGALRSCAYRNVGKIIFSYSSCVDSETSDRAGWSTAAKTSAARISCCKHGHTCCHHIFWNNKEKSTRQKV